MIATININDQLTPYYKQAVEGLSNRRGLMAAVGQRFTNVHLDHFAAKNDQPNKRNWPKRNFWNRIRDATALEQITDRDATVRVADEALTFRINGGTITPKRGKYLAIPANAEAYEAGSPREGMGDRLSPMVRYRGGRRRVVALVENAATQIKIQRRGKKTKVVQTGTIAGGRVMYWLVPSVTIPKDDTALPPPEKVNSAVAEEAGQYLDRVLRRAQGGG